MLIVQLPDLALDVLSGSLGLGKLKHSPNHELLHARLRAELEVVKVDICCVKGVLLRSRFAKALGELLAQGLISSALLIIQGYAKQLGNLAKDLLLCAAAIR